MTTPALRRRRYKKLKQKIKDIEKLKKIQNENTRRLSKAELLKLEKEDEFKILLKEMYIAPRNKNESPSLNTNPFENVINKDLFLGCYAFLNNLSRVPKFNGKVVKLLNYFNDKERWQVRILKSDKDNNEDTPFFLVKSINLLPIKTTNDDDKSFTKAPRKVKNKKNKDQKIKSKQFMMNDDNNTSNIKISILEKCSLLMYGFVHKTHKKIGSECINLIYQYFPLNANLNIRIYNETEQGTNFDEWHNDISFKLDNNDTIKRLKKTLYKLYGDTILNECESYKSIHLWFKFGQIQYLLYPKSNVDNIDEYNRLIEIPTDQENMVRCGDICIGKIEILLSMGSRYNMIHMNYKLSYDHRLDIYNICVGDIFNIFSLKYREWLECVVKHKKKNIVYIHYIGYDSKCDVMLPIQKLIANGISPPDAPNIVL